MLKPGLHRDDADIETALKKRRIYIEDIHVAAISTFLDVETIGQLCRIEEADGPGFLLLGIHDGRVVEVSWTGDKADPVRFSTYPGLSHNLPTLVRIGRRFSRWRTSWLTTGILTVQGSLLTSRKRRSKLLPRSSTRVRLPGSSGPSTRPMWPW